MTTKKHLLEAATLIGEPANEDGTWKVRVISEGKGSSGVYTAELLEKHHSAFDDILSFKNHPVGWDGPETRDFTMISGEIVGKTWVENDERGLKAIYANYRPDPEYKDKLSRYREKLGLSVYIEGSGYVDENSGEFIVDWFNPEDPYASLDVVIAAGARGKFMENMRKNYEAREDAVSDKTKGKSPAEERNTQMDEATKAELAKLFADALAPLVTEKQAAQAEAAQVEADEKVVEARLAAYDAAVEAIEAAELPAEAAKSLRAEAKKGVDVAPLIEFAKAVKDGENARMQESAAQGRNFGSRKVESATDLGKVFG